MWPRELLGHRIGAESSWSCLGGGILDGCCLIAHPPPRHHSSPDVVRGLEGLKRVGGGAQMWPWRGERPDFGGGGCRPDVAGG